MITKDKILHFMVGLVFGLSYYFILLWSFFFGSIAFFGKEFSDKYDIDTKIYKHKATGFDWCDIIADYLGFAIGLTIAILIK